MGFQLRDTLEQRPRLEIGSKFPRGMKILTHPAVQIPGLADIDDPVESIPK
jgi:hypothetical protein